MEVTVTLNGTGENPYHRMGLKGNPFPAIPDAAPRFAGANRLLADLDANPIKNTAELRKRLAGCSTEFIEACIKAFKPGKRVRFKITFPDLSD